jgi:heterodisulfide reductase subunit A2
MTFVDTVACLLCRCHGEIDDVVDFDRLQLQLADDGRVDSVEVCDALCLGDSLANLARKMGADNGSRTLIAGCSALARGDELVDRLTAHGIDPGRVKITDIREGCAWIHADQPKEATSKAADLVRMGITALLHRQTSPEVEIEICPRVLVIGSGPAGMAAAVALGSYGVSVVLVESTGKLGGMLNYLSRVAPGDRTTEEIQEPLVEAIRKVPNIQVHLGTRVDKIEGSAGNFEVFLSGKNGETRLETGAIIVATGAKPVLPRGMYRYGELAGVISGMEMEKIFKDGMPAGDTVFIQCVAVRNQARPYCSAVCCPASLKNAIRLKESNNKVDVTILHRDVMSPGRHLEELYRCATAAGVGFIRFDPDDPPRVEGNDKVAGVRVADALSGQKRLIEAERVVLATPLEPRENSAIPLSADNHGFYTVQSFLHTVETTVPGLFVCGSARWPVMVDGALTQGRAAAAKALDLVSRPKYRASGLIGFQGTRFACAQVSQKTCTGCGNCVAACPFDACHLEKTKEGLRAVVNPVCCMGCGSCAAVCPNQSAALPEMASISMARIVENAFAGRPLRCRCADTQGSAANQ